MKKITITTVVLLCAAFANVTFAAMPAPQGLYIEGNLGKSFSHYQDFSFYDYDLFGNQLIENTHFSNQTGVGANINFGYKFNPYIAVEAGITHYAPVKITVTDQYGYSNSADLNQLSVDMAVKGILPISNTGLDLFGKAGIARINQYLDDSDVDDNFTSNVGAYWAVGAEYAFTSQLLGNIQFSRAQGNSSADTDSLDLASVGISYLFS